MSVSQQASSPGPDRQSGDERFGGNLRRLTGWHGPLLTGGGCVASGLLLSAAFPPLGWDWVAWLALIPLLLAPMPATWPRQFVVGYLFGFSYNVVNLFWLNEIGFGAGVLLALCCAFYQALWYVAFAQTAQVLGARRFRSCPCMADVPHGWRHGAAVLSGAAMWVGVEWVRGWLFTGFPWNALGISQWQHTGLLCLTTFTGVAGISFLLAAGNIGLALTARGWWHALREGKGRGRVSWGLATVALLSLAVVAAIWRAPRTTATDTRLRVLAIQGNIPQCRFWTEEQFEEALGVYTDLTRLTAPVVEPDIVVWPESAVPAPLGYPPFREELDRMMADVRVPLLLGAVDSRPLPGARWTGTDWEPPAQEFNSAILLGPDAKVLDYYDKIHRVPFGEYVPFGRYLPWLVDLIGMGRGLTPGREFTVMAVGKGAQVGVNICFEDAFPDISREFVRRGADVLMTLTNDAWYAESAGSKQHMIHAVFRAAENRRPLLRSGNNSDTCLILPDGTVTGLLHDAATGNPFVRGTNVYSVPILHDPPVTFYARHGDWFAILNGVLTATIVAALMGGAIRMRARLLTAITAERGKS